MSLPNVLTNDSWYKDRFNSFVQVMAKLNKDKITEHIFTKKNIDKYKFSLSDIGEMDQILEWKDEKLGIWKIINVEYANGQPTEVKIRKLDKTGMILYQRMGDVEMYNEVFKVSHGRLKPGIITLDDDGTACFVREIKTVKEQDNKKSFQDELNNPLRKIVHVDVVVVIYSEELNPYEYDYGIHDEDYKKEDDGNGFSKNTKQVPLAEFSKDHAMTTFTTLAELHEKLEDIKDGKPVLELENVIDDEKSNGLVSTSNKDFLKSIEKTVDDRRNAALVAENCLNRIVAIKRAELEKQKRALDAILVKQKQELQALYAKAEHAIAVFKKQLKKIQRLITTLEIYLGIHENVIQICEGEPAPANLPIHLFQQIKFMDEEVGDPTDGGLDYSKIEQWDEWVVQDRNFEKIIPMPRGICVMQVRRFHKERDPDMHPQMRRMFEMLDKKVYVMIRNGDNVYRIWSEHIDMPGRMFPKRSEIQDLLDEMQKDVNNSSDHYRDEVAEKADEKFDEYIFNYKRIILMVQGILYRTEIFVPLPLGLDLFKPETHAGKVVFVYDDELSLPDGRLSFADWHSNINSTIIKGSRILLGRGDFSSSRNLGDRIMTKDRLVIQVNEHTHIPGPENDVYSVEEYKTEEWKYVTKVVNREEYLAELKEVVSSTDKDKKDELLNGTGSSVRLDYRRSWVEIPENVKMQYMADQMMPESIKRMYTFYELYTWAGKPSTRTSWVGDKRKTTAYTQWSKVQEKTIVKYLCIRYNPGDTVYAGWGKSFRDGNGYSRTRKVPLTWLIDKYDNFIINYDRISLDDIEYYINSRIERQNYVKTLPLLYTIRKKLIAEMAWEEKFITFTEQEIKRELPIDADLKPLIRRAIEWWKMDAVRVWKRPITEDDTKALVMIKQETKRLIRDELGYKKLDTGVDNTKKIQVFKYKHKTAIAKGFTKSQFQEALFSHSELYRYTREPWKGIAELSKAAIGRGITESTNEKYQELIKKEGEKKILFV